MARALPPLAWFRAFESSARTLSFTAAAQELGLTQSAISQHVSSLEKRFGCLLFVRKNRGLALTDEGRRLAPTVAKAIATLRTVADSFDTETDKRLLTISTSVSIAQWLIVPRLAEFTSVHKDIAIRLMTKVWPDEFSGEDVDIEIRFDSLKFTGKTAGKNSTLLGSNQMVVVGSPSLIERNVGENPEPRLILDFPLIQVVGTSDTWQVWAESHSQTGEIHPVIFVDSHAMAVDLARAGAGIAFTSRTVAAPCLCDGSLIQLEKTSMSAQDGYHLTIFPAGNRDIASKFADWLCNEIAEYEAVLSV